MCLHAGSYGSLEDNSRTSHYFEVKQGKKKGERERERENNITVSGSNLLSVSWLNKLASLYFPGTLNNLLCTHIFFFKKQCLVEKCSSCFTKGKTLFVRVCVVRK